MTLKQTFFKLLLTIYSIIATEVVHANFVNYYDVSNWDTSISPSESNASINIDEAPHSITLIGGNNTAPESVGFSSTIDFTISAEASSKISFEWAYTTNDYYAGYDPFYFLHNGKEYNLSDDNGALEQVGYFEFDVLVGDIIGFRQLSFDSLFGSASGTISNFNAQATAPLPGSFALLGIALVGLNAFRKNRS